MLLYVQNGCKQLSTVKYQLIREKIDSCDKLNAYKKALQLTNGKCVLQSGNNRKNRVTASNWKTANKILR